MVVRWPGRSRVRASRAGPTTAFGRVVGRQAYTKICAEQLCNICCEYHYIHLCGLPPPY